MANGNGRTTPTWWAAAALLIGIIVGLLGDMAFSSSQYVRKVDYRADMQEIKADIKILLQRTAPVKDVGR